MKNNKSRLRYWLNLLTLTVLSFVLTFFILVIYVSNRWVQTNRHPARIIPTGAWLVENDIPYQEIELKTNDDIKLAAWYTPPQNGSVILVAHGYNANRPEDIYTMFAKHGYGVLAWDFRAHGQSGGDTCSLGYYEQLDVEAALNYALAQPEVEHIGAWGGSMGAATVILTAAKRPEIEAVVSDSAYPSLEDVMRLNTPIKIMQPFVLFFAERLSRAELDQVRPWTRSRRSVRGLYLSSTDGKMPQSPWTRLIACTKRRVGQSSYGWKRACRIWQCIQMTRSSMKNGSSAFLTSI